MTADGVIDAPTWTFEYGFPDKQAEAITAFAEGCKGILLGRNTFEMFATAWPQRTVEEDPGAPFFNDTTKYVVSGSLSDASIWQNSEIVGAYDADAIRKLKGDVGDLYLSGSVTLLRALLEDGLVDHLHLFVVPLTLGAGPRLFADGASPRKLSLERSDQYENGVVYLDYRPQA
jgi:dihydrofolate reductase